MAAFARTAKNVTEAMSAMAVAVGVAVDQVAKHFESLFYAAQQGGTTVAHLKTLQYTFTQIGKTAGDATAVVTGFMAALRSNPGNAGVLDALGVRTTDAHGKPRDAVKEFDDFQSKLNAMPAYVALLYSRMFNIPDSVEISLRKNWAAVQQAQDAYAAKLKASGVNMRALAGAAVVFERLLNSVTANFDLLGDKAELVILKQVMPALRALDRWMTAHFGAMSNAINGFSLSLGGIGAVLGGAAGIGIGSEIGASILGVIGALGGPIGAALGASIGAVLGGAIGIALGALMPKINWKKLLFTDWESVLLPYAVSFFTALWDQFVRGCKVALTDIDKMFHEAFLGIGNEIRSWITAIDKAWTGSALYKWLNNKLDPTGKAGKAGGAALPPTGEFPTLPVKPGSFTSSGGALPPGLLHAVGWVESHNNPNAVSPAGAEGKFQFMPSTARAYGLANPFDPVAAARAATRMLHDLLRHYGGNLTKAVAAYNWGSGNLDRDIRQHGAAWRNFLPKETSDYIGRIATTMAHYTAPGHSYAHAAGGVTNHIRHGDNNIKTQITVNGAGQSGEALANSIGRAQRRVHADLLRNTAPVAM
ncbi:MAG: lytic transglycosylase domain-containing protein [Proteobacteria bacterium]|nr:lytic transglycosylase domain-containing protein [Pseudomonadota bacterium]